MLQYFYCHCFTDLAFYSNVYVSSISLMNFFSYGRVECKKLHLSLDSIVYYAASGRYWIFVSCDV